MTIPPPLRPVLDLIDSVVELYLATVIRPFLSFHDAFYSSLNRRLRAALDAARPPDWFTANFITYARTFLVIPCLVLLSLGWVIVPSLIVILVDVGDFLDGVVARYWVDVRRARDEEKKKKKKSAEKEEKSGDKENADDVSKSAPRIVPSWHLRRRSDSYGGFVDAVCDKVFVVPCWIYLQCTVPSSALAPVQYAVLWCLISAEAASGAVRFRAYFTTQGAAPPRVEGLDFSCSAVKADGVGKAKQTLEMVGTALFVLRGPHRYVGLLLLAAAVPLAYESVRRKIKRRVMYVHLGDSGTAKGLGHSDVRFLMRARGMGSRLVVGVTASSSSEEEEDVDDAVENVRAISAVDDVLILPPDFSSSSRVDVAFLDGWGLDYCVRPAGGGAGMDSYVGEDVMEAGRCLGVGEDGVARPVGAKKDPKKRD